MTANYDQETLLKIANGEGFSPREKSEEIIYIVSFPKSGRTWFRVLLSRYKQQIIGNNDFYLKLHDLFIHGSYFSPQYIFTHANSDWGGAIYRSKYYYLLALLDAFSLYRGSVPKNFDLSMCKNSKIIFLLRDPRDILVSSYYHNIYRQKNIFKLPKSRYIRMRLFGIQRIIEFMNFISENYSIHNHLMIRYENLLDQPYIELERALHFSGTKINKEFVNNAISFGQFENMKKMESKGIYGDKLKQYGENPKAQKVRQGKKGAYITEFSQRDLKYIERYIQDHLDDYYSFYKKVTID